MNRTLRSRAGRMVLAAAVATVAAVPVLPAPAVAASGKVTTDFDNARDVAEAVAIQPDGKIVVAGISNDGFALARYNADGSLDPGFGGTGRVITHFPLLVAVAHAVAVLADGRILAAGTRVIPHPTDLSPHSDVVLVRYRPDGSLDPEFGTGGVVSTDIGPTDGVNDLAVQPDGRIVVAGSSRTAVFGDFLLVRYNADGSLDAGFGTGGVVTTDFFGRPDSAGGVSIQADGRIIAAGVAGQVVDGGTTEHFALARYEADGSLDAGFGTGGRVFTDVAGTQDAAEEVTIQSDGRILVAGGALNFAGMPGGFADFALVRYNTDGSLDSGFGTGGRTRTDFASGNDHGSAVEVQATGRIVVAGYGQDNDFGLAGYRPDGSLDPGFGTGGRVTTAFNNDSDRGHAGVLQADDRIIVVGETLGNSVQDFALARYNANGALDATFG